jgi:hypothetical protein
MKIITLLLLTMTMTMTMTMTGWTLISSTVAEEILLTYTKDGRYATIETQKTNGPSWFGGESNSQITISVVHPSALQEQTPIGL